MFRAMPLGQTVGDLHTELLLHDVHTPSELARPFCSPFQYTDLP